MKRHETLNIEYDEYNKNQLIGLNDTQAEALAKHFTELSRRLAEAEFLVDSYENGWSIPTIENHYNNVKPE